jgi:predicted HNH restriction endonuclease
MGVKTSFGRWSAEERNAVLKKTNKAIKNGDIPPASDFICKMCGRGKDEVHRMHYHHESYDDPVKLIPLCSGCHMKLHKQFKREELAKKM